MDRPDPQPTTPSPFRAPALAPLAAVIAIVFIALAIVAGLIVRQSQQESARLEADVAALRNDVESLRGQLTTLAAESERTIVLSLTDGGYFPIRTNAGTLLVAVADVEPVDNSLRVYLRLGNPQSMTYLGFTLGFTWDKGKGEQAFRQALEPGTWTVVPLTLAPADAASTTSLTITSATLDEIPAR